MVAVLPTVLQGQTGPISPTLSGRPTVDTSAVAPSPVLGMLLEKTIFSVDVLRLRLRFGEPAASQLRELTDGGIDEKTRLDSAAALARVATDAWVRIVFERGLSLGQFTGAVLDNVEKAVDEGWLEMADYRRMQDSLPVWFDFLEARRIQDGDQLLYRIEGPSLRTIYVGVEGAVWLDQTDRGEEPPRILLASYFVRGSDFRDGLLDSLFDARN